MAAGLPDPTTIPNTQRKATLFDKKEREWNKEFDKHRSIQIEKQEASIIEENIRSFLHHQINPENNFCRSLIFFSFSPEEIDSVFFEDCLFPFSSDTLDKINKHLDNLSKENLYYDNILAWEQLAKAYESLLKRQEEKKKELADKEKSMVTQHLNNITTALFFFEKIISSTTINNDKKKTSLETIEAMKEELRQRNPSSFSSISEIRKIFDKIPPLSFLSQGEFTVYCYPLIMFNHRIMREIKEYKKNRYGHLHLFSRLFDPHRGENRANLYLDLLKDENLTELKRNVILFSLFSSKDGAHLQQYVAKAFYIEPKVVFSLLKTRLIASVFTTLPTQENYDLIKQRVNQEVIGPLVSIANSNGSPFNKTKHEALLDSMRAHLNKIEDILTPSNKVAHTTHLS